MKFEAGYIFAGRYRLIELIGKGGFSAVWKVTDQMANDQVLALKIYAPDGGMDNLGIAVFSREYSNVLHLNHPHLLTARHYDIWEGSPYLVLSYCQKGSLYKKMMLGGALSERELAKVLNHVSSALVYLHGKGVIHQDIKPDNILINDDEHYVLTDFGISSRLRQTLRKNTNSSSSLTVAYAPPERFGAVQERLPAGDVFSLGVLIYELATGELPWMGAGGAVLRSDSPLPKLPKGFSAQLEKLVHELLAFDPSKRPTSTELTRKVSGYLGYIDNQYGNSKFASDQSKYDFNSPTDPLPPKGKIQDSKKAVSGAENIKSDRGKKDWSLPLFGALFVVFMAFIGYWLWLPEGNKDPGQLKLYHDLVQEAREELKNQSFQEALSLFQEAQQFCEDDCYKALEGEKTTKDIILSRFQTIVHKGDSLLAESKFEEAKLQYELAEEWALDRFDISEKLQDIEGAKKKISQKKVFRSTVDKNQVLVNEKFKLILSVKDVKGSIIPPDLSNFHLVFGPAKNTSNSFVNGVPTKLTTFTYTLKAESPGRFWIGGATVNTDNGVFSAEPIFVTVLESDAIEEKVKDVDGNSYGTVRIDNQLWMSENLRTTRYNNGDPIINIYEVDQWRTFGSGAWCWYGNNAALNQPYGKLYNWQVVNDRRNVCPVGWHVPTIQEWVQLGESLGGLHQAGGKLKKSGTLEWEGPNVKASNDSGFSGLPGGYVMGTNYFLHYEGYWWSSTSGTQWNRNPEDIDLKKIAWGANLHYGHPRLAIVHELKNAGFSIRCLKD